VKKSALGVLFLTVFVDLLGFGIVLPLLPLYAKDHGASPGQIGLLFASFSAMQLLFAPLWGRLSDRHGRRPMLMLGLFGSVLSYTLFAFAPDYTWLLVSRAAAGFFGATIGTAQAYIADVTGHHDRGKQMALIGAAFGVGFAFGPSIGGLSHGLSPRAPGLIAAGFSLLAFLIAWRKLPEPERHVGRIIGGAGGLKFIANHPVALLAVALQVIVTFCFANFEGTLALFSRDRWQFDILANGFLFTYLGALMLVFQGLVVRRLMPRVGEARFAMLGCLLLGGGLLGIALGGRFVVMAVAVLGFSMTSPSLASLLSQATPADMQGEVLGIGQSGLALARIFGPWSGNLLFGLSPEAPYEYAAAVMAIGLLGSLLLAARVRAVR